MIFQSFEVSKINILIFLSKLERYRDDRSVTNQHIKIFSFEILSTLFVGHFLLNVLMVIKTQHDKNWLHFPFVDPESTPWIRPTLHLLLLTSCNGTNFYQSRKVKFHKWSRSLLLLLIYLANHLLTSIKLTFEYLSNIFSSSHPCGWLLTLDHLEISRSTTDTFQVIPPLNIFYFFTSNFHTTRRVVKPKHKLNHHLSFCETLK